MKALAIDSASARMTVSAKNESNIVSLSLDIGPRQSQELLPAVDYVLGKAALKANELDYTVLCKGPGTFTGLRLAFAALKAIELSNSKPVYGVSTLECYAAPYSAFKGQVVSTIDAKKNQFFAAIYENGRTVMEGQDTTAEKVVSMLNKKSPILCTGPDAAVFEKLLSEKCPGLDIASFNARIIYSETLFDLAEKMIKENKEPLKDYEGPEYLRKSEAELALEGN